MAMKNATRSAVAQAVPSSSSSSTPTNGDISRIPVKARWLIRMLAWVRATLDDAEDMNITEESVRDWLRELQAVADAAEDLLDEFPHEALRLGFVADGGQTAGSIMELPRQRKRASELRGQRKRELQLRGQRKRASEMDSLRDQRMEDILSSFMKIKKPEEALKLDCREKQTHAESVSARRATFPAMEEPHILGRDEELAKIKQFLLSSDAEEPRGSDDMDDHVSVMAIVGMGGLGKTTLAQLAYSESQVNQHFQLKSWVCVSEDFDVIQLTKAMLQSLNVEANGLSELDPLQRKLLQKLKGQERLLLVLDDVWEADNLNIHSWNLLMAPLRNRSADTKIIMTTRSRKVSEMMSRNSTYDLGFLSDEDTLELFMLHAFEGRDPNSYLNLVAIGKETARKCKGVPLAAKTLGGLLRTKDDEEWNKILESEVWNTIINQEDSIIPILRLSYRHLPAPLKRCFRYCSLFPKDSVFDRNQIIRMWMAQGYIKANRRELMEDIGQRYIDNLLSRSFFQKYPRDPKRLQMHDLMHDLARCVSGDECYSMEGCESCLIPSHVQHLSNFPSHPSGSIILSKRHIPEPKSIRTFLSPYEKFVGRRLVRESLCNSYTRMEHLRVLDLHGVWFHRLPESIARLKHLRYLRISSFVKKLPECVCSLHHLQTLDLEGVSELPYSMSNLLNLRHLILHSKNSIDYPEGIGKLIDLQTVPGFYVSSEHNRAKLGELKDMNNIRGEFAINGLHKLADVNEAKKACLDKKRSISSLHLGWDPNADWSPIDDEVLESLKPTPKLESLQISDFKGPSYPSWLADWSFSRLDTITLVGCGKWISLPPLGQLPSLRSLYVSGACAVEYIGSEFFSGGFPQLEKLTLGKMDNWKSWCGAQEGECPKLKKLSIEGSPNLESLSLINLGALEDISISWCARLNYKSGNFLELLNLQHVHTIKISKNFKVWCIQHAPPLDNKTNLYLEDAGQLEAEHVLGVFSHICRLTVKRCRDFTYLPLGNQSALESVEISDCPNLRITSVSRRLWQLPSLQIIDVHWIHGAERIKVARESYAEFTNVDQHVASFLLKGLSHMIRRLIIIGCANLTSLPWTYLTSLEYLRIIECPWFRLSGAEQLPPTLQVLCIWGNSCVREQCSRHQHFQRLKQIQQRPYKQGADQNLYLVFRNVHDACEAADFCSKTCMQIHTLEIEWDCCTNDRFKVVDSVAEEVLGKLYHPLGAFWDMIRNLDKLVIQGYNGSRFASSFWDHRLHGLSSVTLQECSNCEILPPLSQLRSLKELFVEGASSLETFAQDYDISEQGWQETQTRIAFPRLKNLEFHNMPVWKEWLGTKEGDFPLLRKLILKHCPKLRALPNLPPRLKELELEACDELTSLSIFDSPNHATRLICLKPLTRPSLPATEGTTPIFLRMSLTNCPLLLTLCEEHPRILAGIPNLLIDGVGVHTEHEQSIRSQIKRIRENGGVSHV